VFVALVVAFAVALWGTVLRPPAYEVRGAIVGRPAANLILVQHEAVAALGMAPMELMAVFSDPALLERAAVKPGDRVRMAVRRRNDELTLLRIEKLPPGADPAGDKPPPYTGQPSRR
jgi:hypothetical protein